MTRNKLIGAVALQQIRFLIDQETEGSLRFCILGFESSLVRSIAKAVLDDPDLSSIVLVKIPSAFDTQDQLPKEIRSDESITHWRHCKLPEGKRAVLFAAVQEELQRNEKSVEKITKIETDTLRMQTDVWIKKAGLTRSILDKTPFNHLKVALKSANEMDAARKIETFADFAISISNSVVRDGNTLEIAIDNALPKLRLPRNAGGFNQIPKGKKIKQAEWNQIFRKLNRKIRPLLVKETELGDTIQKDDLRSNLKELSSQGKLDDKEIIATINEFIDTDLRPDEWLECQQKFVEIDWEIVSPLFLGFEKPTSTQLNERTIEFFEDEFPDSLGDEDKDLLSVRFPKEPSDQLRNFFESYREHLSQAKKLSSDWEKYIFRNPKSYSDFLIGLLDSTLALRRRTSDADLSECKLRVSIRYSEKKSFWEKKNPHIVQYFAFRYRGLAKMLGDNVVLAFGKLEEYYFPQIHSAFAGISYANKEARSIKFEVALDPEGVNSKLIFHWEMPVLAIARGLPDDLISIANDNGDYALLPTADITRQSVSSKGSMQRIALNDINTMRDVTNTNQGKLVDPNQRSGNCHSEFLDELTSNSNNLPETATDEIRRKFDQFLISYTKAIREWTSSEGEGISSNSFVAQAKDFANLLDSLAENADNDQARQKIWQKILRIGIAMIGAGSTAAIITPWHPIRLAAIHIKTKQAADIIHEILGKSENEVSGAELWLKQAKHDLESNYYPEVCFGIDDIDGRKLLSAADTMYDYTLAEPPERSKHRDMVDAQDFDPKVAAKAFGTVGEQYLKLLPHERNNLTVVLYNAESKGLPSELAEELWSKVHQENELRCNLLLTHSDQTRIRQIYEEQNATAKDESGSIMASDAASGFLSRMRVSLLEIETLSGENGDPVADLVALQDVISRQTEPKWKESPNPDKPNLVDHIPTRWSRRRPIRETDRTTSVYLACPSQPREGQIYLNTIHRFLDGDDAKKGDVIPVREINFDAPNIKKIFDDAHQIGEWVVNFDHIVDRRLLTNCGVEVVRYMHDRFVDRNIVVSTKSKPKLISEFLRKCIEEVDPSLLSENDQIIEKITDRARDISGQIIMRAARYGHYAKELLGIVLSMEKISSSLAGEELPIGWYFLDDFSLWFGQYEEQIADIMSIAPRMENGKPVLKLTIAEAKYVSSSNYRDQAKKSRRQLVETTERIARALDPSQERIDRDVWLHRIANLMIEGMKPFDASDSLNNWDLHKWSDEVRWNNVPIYLLGNSHVFVHDKNDTVSFVDIENPRYCKQEIFCRNDIAQALKRFRNPVVSDHSDWSKALCSRNAKDVALLSSRAEKLTVRNDGDLDVEIDANDQARKNTKVDNESEEILHPIDSESQSPLEMRHTADSFEGSVKYWPSSELANWVGRGKVSGENDKDTNEWLQKTVSSLRRALLGYDMTAEIIDTRLTPNAALVRLKGTDHLTVSKVEKRREELLTSHSIKVISVLAAPSEVIIMVARESRTILNLKDLWRQRDLPASAPKSNTSLLLGACEDDGRLLYLNVEDEFGGLQSHGPHTLIAGQSGSGKGILVQCLLLDICATNSPTLARIQMIDPKAGIDFPWLRQMPHLNDELITDQVTAVEALEALVNEMERRNHLLASTGVTKLSSYNRKVELDKRLPRIWLFHDELADWMMIKEYRNAVELNVNRLGIKARAAGINLVLVTQRPDKEALPMQLRANLSNRLVLKVADKRNSELALDEAGAEQLLGRGHLAAKLSGEGRVILAQVPYIGENEITELASIIERSWKLQNFS